MSDDSSRLFNGKRAGNPARNGLPEFQPYVWHDPDAAREAQVKAILAGIRAQLTEEAEEELPATASGRQGSHGLLPPSMLKGCGTEAAYQRHRRRGEQPCQACTEAQNTARAIREDARRAMREGRRS